MSWLRRLARNRLLDIGAAFVALLNIIKIATRLPSRVVEWDFCHFYATSWLLLRGQNPYTTSNVPISQQFGFATDQSVPVAAYPPSFLWLFAPLTTMPPRTAFAIWTMGEVVCLMIILWLTRQLLCERLSARGWFFVCAVTVASPVLFWQFQYSQVQLLLAVVVLGAYAAHLRKRDNLACLLVMIAGLLKLYPVIFLPWFVWRSAGAIGTRVGRAFLVLVCGAVAVLATGFGLWRDFFQFGLPAAATPEVGVNFHYSLSSLVINLGLTAAGLGRSLWATRMWWIAGTVIGLFVIALAYLPCLRAAPDQEIEFSLLTVAMLVGTITVQGHYFVWLIFPLVVAVARVAARPSAWRIMFIALIVLIVDNVTPPDPVSRWSNIYLWILLNYLPLLGLMALGVFLTRELVDPYRQSPSLV